MNECTNIIEMHNQSINLKQSLKFTLQVRVPTIQQGNRTFKARTIFGEVCKQKARN